MAARRRRVREDALFENTRLSRTAGSNQQYRRNGCVTQRLLQGIDVALSPNEIPNVIEHAIGIVEGGKELIAGFPRARFVDAEEGEPLAAEKDIDEPDLIADGELADFVGNVFSIPNLPAGMLFHGSAGLWARDLGQQENLLRGSYGVFGNGCVNFLRPELTGPLALKAESRPVGKICADIESVLGVALSASVFDAGFRIHCLQEMPAEAFKAVGCEAVDGERLVKTHDHRFSSEARGGEEIGNTGFEDSRDERNLLVARTRLPGFPPAHGLLFTLYECGKLGLAGDTSLLAEFGQQFPKTS
jgi:hypothetical protein